VATGSAIRNPFQHDGVVNDVIFARDGQTILSGGDDRKAQLWDVQTGKAVGQPLQHSSKITNVALSADGSIALTIGIDGTARLWDARSCNPLGRPLEYERAWGESLVGADSAGGPVKCIDGEFNSQGSTILFICSDGTARLYQIPQPLPNDSAMIRAWARSRSGFELDENGVPRQLSQADWLAAQRESADLRRLP
jgi:WD40 repeat protein